MAAADILSRIQILLDADTASFETNLREAGNTADSNFTKIRDKANQMGAGIAAGALAGVTGLLALTHETIEAASEIQKVAELANISTEQLQYYAAGAKQLGIEQDALGDIFKDVNEKIGEFVATEGGGLADFFDNIAPRVGVTADQFARLSGPDALLLYVDSLEKAGLSQQQMTYYLESFASDATNLLPLLKNGGEGFKAYGDAAKATGAIIGNDVIASTNELYAAQTLLDNQIKGLKNEIVAATIPTMVQFANAFSDTSESGVQFVAVGEVISSGIKHIAATAIGATTVVQALGKTIGAFAAASSNMFKDMSWKDMLLGSPLRIFKQADIKNSEESIKILETGFQDVGQLIDDAANRLNNLTDNTGTSDLIKKLAAVHEEIKGYGLTGNIGAKAAEDAAKQKAAADKQQENAAKQLDSAYESQASSLKRQIELYGQTSQAAQTRYDLENGALAKLDPKRKAHLQSLSDELAGKDFKKISDDLEREITLLGIKDDLSKHMYQVEQTKYTEFAPQQKALLLEQEKELKISQDYFAVLDGIQNSEEKRFDTLADQLGKVQNAFNAGKATAEEYASNVQSLLDNQSVLPDFTSGINTQEGIDSATYALENKYALEYAIREKAFAEGHIQEQQYRDGLFALDADYLLRKGQIEIQAEDVKANQQKMYQQTALSFYEKGLDTMAKGNDKYAKIAQKIQKGMALYQIAKDTYAAAIASYKALAGIPYIGPALGFAAAAAAVAFGLAQAKAVMSDAPAGAAGSGGSTPSAASTVTPVAEQPRGNSDAISQSTTITIPADTLFTGRQMVDLINEAVSDGKRINASALSFSYG